MFKYKLVASWQGHIQDRT